MHFLCITWRKIVNSFRDRKCEGTKSRTHFKFWSEMNIQITIFFILDNLHHNFAFIHFIKILGVFWIVLVFLYINSSLFLSPTFSFLAHFYFLTFYPYSWVTSTAWHGHFFSVCLFKESLYNKLSTHFLFAPCGDGWPTTTANASLTVLCGYSQSDSIFRIARFLPSNMK